MKRFLTRLVVLALIFSGAVSVFAYLINHDVTVIKSRDMDSSNLPLIYMVYKDVEMNPLHGYVQPMSVTQVRDTLTPISTDRDVAIEIQTYGEKIKDVYFEVITADGKTSLENTKVTNLSRHEESINASFVLQNQLRMNREYVLKIQLHTEDRDIYYYTRVVQQDSLHTKEYLDFVNAFSNKSLSKENADTLALYLEPQETTGEGNLSFMDISATTDDIVWGDLNPKIYYKAIPAIKELNETTATVVQEYTISAQSESEKTELYTVTEYFRLRYSNETVMLLDFERSTNEVFNPENDVLTEGGIRLGITEKNISFASDENNQYFAFVQGGDLWTYDVRKGKIAQIFTFRQKNGSDYRDIYGQHQVKIISLDTDGNMYFVVAGYMNRGEHEGESGLALYYYDASSSGITERIFINTQRSYDLLKADVDTLTYVSEDERHFYFLLDGDVYDADLNSFSSKKILEDRNLNCCVGSTTGKYFAWLEENEAYNSKTIDILNLDTQKTAKLVCGESERLRLLGFMRDSLIYGIANVSDIYTEHEGDELFPMKQIFIVNEAGENIKTYGETGIYITGGKIEDRLLTMTRVKRSGDEWVATKEDHIIDNAGTDSGISLTTQASDRKQTEVVLLLGNAEIPDKLQVVRSRFVVTEGGSESTARTEMVIDAKDHEEETYYVYAKGKLYGIYQHANTAIREADRLFGIVVNQEQLYIWERGNRPTESTIPLNQIATTILNCETDLKKLEAALSDRLVLDLSGCTMDQILYFIGEGNPVLANTADGWRVLNGYDQWGNVSFYNPKATGEDVYTSSYYDEEGNYVEDSNKRTAAETYLLSDEDSLKLFENAGNEFIGFIKLFEEP
ncbi:MAG: hypothetical protein Q4B01_01535 [Eubacteriales bacterium]|nr:hypothetical protein [Eubacteriales bacterium]